MNIVTRIGTVARGCYPCLMVAGETPGELLQFLAPYSPKVQELFLATRNLVRSKAEGASEFVYDATNAACVGFSYTHSHVKGVFWIAAATNHVNLGFTYGAKLWSDLAASKKSCAELLVGEGKQSRHIRIEKMEDLLRAGVEELLEEALARAFHPEPALPAKLFVKVYEGPKYRPGSRR